MKDQSRLSRWDSGCASDPVRNDIVLPHLADLINQVRPRTVGDLGCGTGYITRQLAQRVSHRTTHWLLMDKDPKALRFAARRPVRVGTLLTRRIDLTSTLTSVDATDLAFAAFTLLEFTFTPTVARNLGALVNAGGILSIFVPDPLDELTRLADRSKMSAYAAGSVSLDKIDKFTGTPYPFHLNRTDKVIRLLAAAGFRLHHLAAVRHPRRDANARILVMDLIKEREIDVERRVAS